MEKCVDVLPSFVDQIRKMREIIISNIVLLGQIPAPTFQEKRRAECLVERFSDFQADECVIDDFGNPIGIIRGSSEERKSIFVVAHLDTFSEVGMAHNYVVTDKTISGIGVSDNSAAVGVLASLPEVFRRLGIQFESDVVLVAPTHSLGKGNLNGIRQLLSNWEGPIRGGICLETVKLGRLNYYSDGMIRGEINCSITSELKWGQHHPPNAILVLNEVINEILELRLPQKPRTKIVIGRIRGGFDHGKDAYNAQIGFEIRSDADRMVKALFDDIQDIVYGVNNAYAVELKLRRISNLNATRLDFGHPLVKCASKVLHRMGVEIVSNPSETALSIFLQRNIPAITLGLTDGTNYHTEDSIIEISPIFKGIAQTVALVMAVDNGVCDG
jgi:acetylornithine deacetylase/succinyl-diaminopimelate desuccinylase-like protein